MVSSAAYLRETSEVIDAYGYTRDCVAHACRIAELLLAEGRAPWIGRVRDRRGDFHGPLTPTRFKRNTWTTHYVACSGDEVFDPLAGAPLSLSDYAPAVFGRPLSIERFLTPEQTAELLARNELRKACR